MSMSSFRVLALLLLTGCSGSTPNSDAMVGDRNVWPVLPQCIYDFGGAPEERQPQLMTGSAGNVSYRLWRCATGPGIGISDHFRGDAFELVIDGTSYRTMGDSIVYTNTLHNWGDSLVATHPQGSLRWQTRWSETDDLTYYVSATDPAGGTLLAETQVR
jgi:hypothetical protein